MQIATSYPALAYDGELTFAGMLRKYFIENDEFGNNVGISKRWNDDTKGTYIGQYEKRLIPLLAQLYGKDKPLHSYLEDEFETVLEQLALKEHYAESTIQHYRHLLWIVYKAGFERGYYADNIFWTDVIDLEDGDTEEKEELRAKIMTRTRRSFSIDEELGIIDWFCGLNPETASGEDIGLLFMFFQGLRNNEACGANLRSVHLLHNQGIPVFDMIQSTAVGSNQVKAGGKTSNAPRVIPILDAFYRFLSKRKAYLERLVGEGALILSAEYKSVDDLPFVCCGNDYLKRASSKDLTMAGRALFEKVGIDKRTLAVLHQVLCSNEFKNLQIDEKEPTTYLFRRNFATHLFLLGFSLDEIQYIIGHDVEDPYKTRNSFADEEVLQGLWARLQRHPVNEVLLEKQGEEVSEFSASMGGSVGHRITLKGHKGKEMRYDILVDSCEPAQPITVAIESKSTKFEVMLRTSTLPADYPRTANIISERKIAYRRHL